MLSTIKKLVPSLAFFMPLVMFAQVNDIDDLAQKITDILGLIIPILLTIALIYFLIGLVKYIMAAGDDEAKSTGRSMMINGVIALFVMVAVWGFVNVLTNTFFGGGVIVPPDLPELPGNTYSR
ncbi:MAG TPA: hypothetical protein VJL36_01445 [Candidatus Paceibacterota bacterium]